MRALSTDAELGRLYSLVDIFAHATLAAYLEFHAAHGAFLAGLGVDHERSVETMRLLTICSLASANHVVAYDAIAAALQVRCAGRADCARAPPFPPSPLYLGA